LARYFRRPLGLDAVAMVSWAGDGWAAEAFSQTFTSLGGTITGWRDVTSTADYTNTLSAVMMDNPEALFYADLRAGAAITRPALLSAVADGLGLTTVGWDAGSLSTIPPSYTATAGLAAQGDYISRQYLDTADMPGYPAFNSAYQAAGFTQYGDEATALGAYAYDAAQIIIDAIRSADTQASGDVRDEIAATVNYAGVVGTYQGFDAHGDVVPQWAQLDKFEDGAWAPANRYDVVLPLVLRNLP
jgi:branched-chain amino acid transport system substrate-binding protein